MGGRRVAVLLFILVAVLASACTGTPDPAATNSTLGAVEDETEAGDGVDVSADPDGEADAAPDDADAPDSVPAEPVSIVAERGDAIERLLVAYTNAINERRAEDAYELFTDALRERVPLDDLVDGTSTSFISRLSVAQVAFGEPDAATVIAAFRTDQAPELGRDGQSCSIWELEYRVLDLGGDDQAPGDWRIDQATPLGGSPFPCPVITPEPDQPEQSDPVPPVPPGEKPIVHLTLDDGPGPETERFLDLFAEFDVGATFFMNSNRIAGREAVVRRVIADGHAIANHTHSHCNLANPNALTPPALCGSRTAEAEIEDAQRIISAATGITPTCFRPPYGAQSSRTKALVESYGLANWLWDIDTNDWKFNANNADYSDAQAVAELDKAAGLRPSYGSSGVIILLHDGTASAPRMLRLLRTWLEANADTFDFRVLDNC